MTASLFRSLGGWTPDRSEQRRAIRLAMTSVEDATEALDALSVPEASACAQRVQELHQLVPSDRFDQLSDLLALSPDPNSAALALVTLFEHVLDSETAASDLGEEAVAAFTSLASQSRFLARYLSRQPGALVSLTKSGALAEPRTLTEFMAFADNCLETYGEQLRDGESEAFELALRERRRLELARIYYREVLGLATIETSCREVADLAAGMIQAAYGAARLELSTRDADLVERLEMSVIGMGKLGSRELNFSSDIDIIFVSSNDVVEDPALAELGETLARRTRDLLDTPLANGRVFRVDLRLRPDGSLGPLIAYPRGLREYYSRLARTWERAALLRARVVAGESAPGLQALELLDPIRYPKIVDPSAVEEVRAMKDRIDRHESWRKSGRAIVTGWDSKVGRGGIREIEFIVAAFQILLAGQQPQLRNVSTFEGLGRLAALRGLDPADANDLLVAYEFYRQLEHRLQMDEDRQTQRLPTAPLEQLRLARRLGFATWTDLNARLDQHRSRVREIFERMLVAQPEAPIRRESDELLDSLSAFMAGHAARNEVLEAFSGAGFERPRSALGALQILFHHPRGAFSAQALQSPDRLPSYLLDGVLASPDPDASIVHLTDLLTHTHAEAIVKHLRAKPAMFRSVMTLFGASDLLARRLVRTPRWIDQLLTQGARVLQTRPHLEEAWARTGHERLSLEGRLNLLRRFKSSQELRIAAAYLDGTIDDVQLSDQLTLLAEFTVGVVLAEATADLADFGGLDDFVIIAMGTFGGMELGFASDLDLVFIFEDEISLASRYAKLCRRLIHFLNMPMPDGILYHVDLRLRPHGGEGTVVTNLAHFADYYANRADAWERIALLRSRPVAGSHELSAAFAPVKTELCRIPLDTTSALVKRLDDIRQQLMTEHAKPKPGSVHLKYGSGGIMEIELVAQISQLIALSRPDTDRRPDNPEPSPRIADTLDWLRRNDLLDQHDTDILCSAYRFYRRIQNVLRLTQDRSVSRVSPTDPSLKRVRGLLGRHDERLADPTQLESILRGHLTAVRAVYERIMRELESG